MVFTCICHDYLVSLDPHGIIIICTKCGQITHHQTINLCPKNTQTYFFLHHSCTRVQMKDWSEPTHNSLQYHSHIYSLYIKRCCVTIALFKINRVVYFSHIGCCRIPCKVRQNVTISGKYPPPPHPPMDLHNYMT